MVSEEYGWRTAMLNKTGNGENGMERTIKEVGKQLMAVQAVLSEGEILDAHAHPEEQMTFVISGSLEFTLDETTTILKTGDSIMVPSGAVHSVRTLQEAVVLDVFSPIRKDLLPENSGD